MYIFKMGTGAITVLYNKNHYSIALSTHIESWTLLQTLGLHLNVHIHMYMYECEGIRLCALYTIYFKEEST